jgi:hypothetical protein
MDHKSPIMSVVASAGFAGYFSGYVVNALEVVKTTALNRAFSNNNNNTSVSGVTCAKSNCGMISVARNLVQREGISSMFRGSTSQCLAGMIRAPVNIVLYETSKLRFIKDLRYFRELFSGNELMSKFAPGLSVFISKSVAVPCGLYFEQLATRQQGGILVKSAKAGKFDGLGYILGRELLFSVVFWTLNEHLYKVFSEYTNRINATTASAMVAGIAGGLASYPMDALRTWKISFPEKFYQRSSVQVIKSIIAEEGARFLFSGLYLRVLRSSLGNTAFFYLYALSSISFEKLSTDTTPITKH